MLPKEVHDPLASIQVGIPLILRHPDMSHIITSLNQGHKPIAVDVLDTIISAGDVGLAVSQVEVVPARPVLGPVPDGRKAGLLVPPAVEADYLVAAPVHLEDRDVRATVIARVVHRHRVAVALPGDVRVVERPRHRREGRDALREGRVALVGGVSNFSSLWILLAHKSKYIHCGSGHES